MTTVTHSDLPLQRIYAHEKNLADRVYLTQPYADGHCVDYTWKQAVYEARCIAKFLNEQGFPKGSCIAIMSKNCAHWLMADMAIWMAGHVSVPLYPTLTRASVKQILEHCEARLVFVGKLDDPQEMLAGVPQGMQTLAFPAAPPAITPTWDSIKALGRPIEGEPTCKPDDIATLIYTSGTTGTPKGVIHTHATLAWAPIVLQTEIHAQVEDRIISYLPLSHVAERSAVEMLSFRVGLHVYFTESLATFLSDIQRARPTVFLSVPRLWVKFQQGVSAKLPEKKLRMLLRIPFIRGKVKKKILTQLGLNHVRVACSGAAPTPESVLNWYRALGLQLLEGYGMTEVFGLSHLCRPHSMKVGHVGEVMADVHCRISDTGEVLVKSQGNTTGYYLDPEKTADLFTPDGYIQTGDKGEIDQRGRLRITGRVKEIFKTSKGKYVAPAPIENLLTAHSSVEACCVNIGQNESQPYALLVLSQEAKNKLGNPAELGLLREDLKAHLAQVNQSLDEHERIAFLAVCSGDWTVDNGMVTPTFKVKRHVVESAYVKHTDAWYATKSAVLFE